MKTPLVFRIFKNGQIHVVKQFIDEDRVVFGNGAETHIDLESEDISPIHCLVEKRGRDFYLCDLGSSTGTNKNGQSVLDQVIRSGENFEIGPYSIQFFIGAAKHQTVLPASVVTEPSAVAKPVIVVPAKQDKDSSDSPAQTDSDNNALVDRLRVGQGSQVEVLVCWQERVIQTYHFAGKGAKHLGLNSDVSVPEGTAPKNFKLLSLDNNVTVHAHSEMRMKVLKDGELKEVTSGVHKLNQAEACFIQLINGMQLVVRYAPKSKAIVLDSPFILGSSELTGLLAALIIAVLASLLVSVAKPKPTRAAENEQLRVAQVVFTKPPTLPDDPVVPSVVVENTQKVSAPPVKKESEPLNKAILLDQTRESQVYGDPANPVRPEQKKQTSGTASEIKPKDPKIKPKMFTSTKQGGSVKTGRVNGANAQSLQPDPNNSGLLAAFGEGGARDKLDQVYSGSGELIGAGEKAKGVSGFSSDRDGDDLGSKLKDSGAGGKGTATQGISGVGTKGRGTGMSGYGSGTGFGDKDRVQISAGGSDESFVGSINREAVRRVVMSAITQFKACYEREYRQNTRLEGKVVITWEIHAQGVAKNAKVIKSKSTIGNVIVEECVRSRILGLIFPEPPVGQAAEVTFPFVFKGQKL